MPEKRLVIFDLDNTLIIDKPAEKAANMAAIRFLAEETKLEADKLLNHWKRLNFSLTKLAEAHNIPEKLLPLAQKMYEKELINNIRLNAGAKELVSWLKEEGCLIAIAADTDRGLAKKKLKMTELVSFVDLIISASEVGGSKPNPKFFTLAMENIGTKPNQTAVISESLHEDIQIAKQLGIRTFQIPSNNPQLTALKPELSEFLSFAK